MQQCKSSTRRIDANRANARASTGPRSKPGKNRAAQNSRRHGLSIPVLYDQKLSANVANLALEIAGPEASASEQDLARRIAEAQIDLVRVRQLRCDLLSGELSKGEYISSHKALKTRVIIRMLKMFDRGLYVPLRMLEPFKPLEGPSKTAAIFSGLVHELVAMDRYERRALSRRKFAIRDFDLARQDKTTPR